MEQRLIDANKIDAYLGLEYEGKEITDFDTDIPTVLTIPDNPTNGDLIMSLYKNLFIHEVLAFGNITAIQVSIDKKHMQTFDFDWWNSPYKAEIEPQESGGKEWT